MLSKTVRDNILSQAKLEIAFARRHKKSKIARWHLNENLYYGVKPTNSDARANVDLGRMAEFISSYLSKIDNPLTFKFAKRKESQLKRVQRLNALKQSDANIDFWDMKDLAGKKQCLLYGRAVYAYYADSIDGYKAHLENTDVYDFLIDPAGGGLDMERARYMGRYGVTKDKSELKGNKSYIAAEVKRLIDGVGNATEKTDEEANKQNRRNAQETLSEQQIEDKNKYVFWEWFTTYEGERYYLLMQEGGCAIKIEKLIEMFPATKHFPLGAWPFWSYAASPDITEFWTPAPADQVRDIFMVQNVTINQTLDNVEEHNKPMKVVNVGAVENLAELKYRKGGYIKSKNGFDASQAVQLLRPATIETPLILFDKLEQIQEKASGVTSAAKGAAEEDKVGIYEGNQAAAADRFGLMNKSYAFGYKRFAQLHEMGARHHLNNKVAIDLMGPEGIDTEQVSKRDIFRKDEDFNVLVEASNAEEAASAIDKKNKLGFLGSNAQNPVQSPKKAYETGAKIAGFTDDEIKELMDTSEYGDARLMSEAARDIEMLLDGKQIKPNRAANIAYKQKFVNYIQDHEEDLSQEQFLLLTNYILSCEEIIMQNTARAITQAHIKQGLMSPAAPPAAPQNGTAALQSPAPYGEEAVV